MRKFPVHHHVLKIQHEPVIQDWIQGLSPVAQENYLQMIAEFSLVTGLSPTRMLETTYNEYNENTPSWNLSIKEWFKQFETHSQEYKRSKITYNHRVAIIKGFFHFHELETPNESHKRRRGQKLKFGEGNKRTGLTRADLQRAINACWNSRLKAIILTQCSSGMAVADLVNLKLKDYKKGLVDIGDNRQICMFHFKEGRQKGEKEFYTFISFEAVEAIEFYLEHERPTGYSNPFLFSSKKIDKGLRPFNVQRDLRKLNNILNLKQKQDGDFYPITSHMFRKYFNTQLANTKMSYEARKHLMGHVIQGVDDSYYLGNPEALKELYLEYLPVLLIHEYESVNITTTDEKVEEQNKQIRQLQEEREKDREEMKRLKDAVKVLQKQKDVNSEIEKLKKE